MLSILIPVYNFDVRSLTNDLVEQGRDAKISFELILIDDCSPNQKILQKNRELKEIKELQYIELKKNVGRSKIRNLLAEKSKYNHLIFMDCDSKVVTQKYVKNYLPYCKNDVLVYGGREYEKIPPENKELFFRWYYGKHREVQNAEKRKKNPNRAFMTNNFMISKNLFEKIKFDEKITTYGHEDTIFGYELKKRNISIIHINNPLIHVGLETNSEFLSKTKQGIRNLKYLAEKFVDEKELFEDIKILKYYKKIKKFRLIFIVKFFFKLSKNIILRNLQGEKPNLRLFDFYKLGLFCN